MSTPKRAEPDRSRRVDDNDLKFLWRHVKESGRISQQYLVSPDMRPERRETARAVAENLRAAAKMLEDLL